MAQAQGRWRPGDSGSVRVLLGEFSPEASDQYWDDKFMDFTGSADDFDDTMLLVDYRKPLGGNAAFLLGGGWYEGAATQAYRDWVDASGRDIAHRTTLNTAELTGAVILELGGRRGSVVPYVGIGGGYLWWELTEEGSFIDFGDPDLPVVSARYRSNNGTFEVLALAGLDIRIGDAWSLVFQGRWREADDELGQGLAGLGTLDLSGVDFEGGIAFHF
jgi:hypothetical protein